MKISIAVPSLNYARFLDACLGSIRVQTHTDLEVLIADGGSDDGSLEIARRYADSDPRFRLVSTADNGQAEAVQRAFECAIGQVFGFLNADDCYLHPDALASVALAFERDPHSQIISFGGWYIAEDGSRIRPVRLRYHPLDGHHLMRYRTAVLQPATFWRREVQERVPLKADLCFVFDAWFFYDAFRSFHWSHSDEEVAGYRVHGENKSMGVRGDRIAELALFERHKFGERSVRARYLDLIAGIAHSIDRWPAGSRLAKQALYLTVNAISYASVYRVPGI